MHANQPPCMGSTQAFLQGVQSLTDTGTQVYEFNVPTFGKGVVFDVDHKVRPLGFSAQHCSPSWRSRRNPGET